MHYATQTQAIEPLLCGGLGTATFSTLAEPCTPARRTRVAWRTRGGVAAMEDFDWEGIVRLELQNWK